MARVPTMGGNMARYIRAMNTAAGRELPDLEMDGIATRLQNRVNKLRLERGSASDQTLFREASRQFDG